MDIVQTIAEHVTRTRYEDCPHEALLTSKLSILDALGTAMAGHDAQGCTPVLRLVRGWGGRREAGLWFDGGRVIAPHAALANAVMARALDFDDALTKGVHLSSALLPACLALAELCGGVSGRELLATFTVATDFVARLNEATLDYHGFDPTLTCGIFGVTAAAARLLGLDPPGVAHALGLALNEASGTFQGNIDGVLAVRLNQGLAACEGMKAALFAGAGITGVRNVFGGLYGYPHLYSNDRFAPERLTEGLGSRFAGVETFYKRWPSCGATLAGVDAALALAEDDGVRSEEIREVTVTVGRYHHNLCGSRPFALGPDPSVDAQFSYQYCIANALVRGRPTLEHFFSPKVIAEPAVLALVGRVQVAPDDGYDAHHGVLATRVAVTLESGRRAERFVPFPRGHFRNPMTPEELIEKFSSNAWFARERRLGGIDPGRVVDTVMGLEKVEDVREILQFLKPRARRAPVAGGRAPGRRGRRGRDEEAVRHG